MFITARVVIFEHVHNLPHGQGPWRFIASISVSLSSHGSMEAPSCHAHTADAGHVSLPRNAGSAWLCSRQFSNSFPGAANVEPVAESSIFAFYGCPALPLHEQCTLDGVAEQLQLDTLSAATTPILTSSGVPKISSSNCLDSQDSMSSTLHGGLCLEGEALPRSLGSRHNQSRHPSLEDDTSLLHIRFDTILSLASCESRLGQAVSDLLSRNNHTEQHRVTLSDSQT